MKFRRITRALAVGAVLTAALQANAVPVQNPANGHYYEAIDATGSWAQCKIWAQTRSYNGNPGYLATVSSSDENAFILSLLGTHAGLLGGYQDRGAPDYTEPAGGWRWVTGETWGYTNWNSGEPNNDPGASGNEDAVVMYGNTTAAAGKWNDLVSTSYDPAGDVTGTLYVVEYAPEPATLALLALGVFLLRRVR